MKFTENIFSQTRIRIFVMCMLLCAGLFLFCLTFSPKGTWINLFFLAQDPTDSFMDFFNPIYWSHGLTHVYENPYSIYPPLMTLGMGLLSHVLPSSLFVPEIVWRGFPIRAYWGGQVLLGVFLVIDIGILMWQLFRYQRNSFWIKILFCLSILFSMPFLFWIERANWILLTIIFCLFFVQYYDSKKLYLQHFAILALVFAICMKIYPAAFILLLLRKKQYKNIFLVCIYTLLGTVLPLYWLGGFSKLSLILNNFYTYIPAGQLILGFSAQGIINTWALVLCPSWLPTIIKYTTYLPYMILIVGTGASFILKTKWKILATLCLMMILVPGISGTYTLLFMMVPLLSFVDEAKKITKQDMVYLVLFLLVFGLKIPIFLPTHLHPILLSDVLAGGALLVMFVLLCWQAGNRMYILLKK